jgi:hypothetical protein
LLDFFRAIGTRFSSTDLADELNAITQGRPHPNTLRPYAVVNPTTDTRRSRSNKGIYRDQSLDVLIAADSADDATRLAYLFMARMLEPRLEFAADAGTRLMYLEEGDVVWREEDPYWTATVGFTAAVAMPRRG